MVQIPTMTAVFPAKLITGSGDTREISSLVMRIGFGTRQYCIISSVQANTELK